MKRWAVFCVAVLLLLVPMGVSAQTVRLTPVPNIQFLDSSGNPLNGGHIHTFVAGTTTPQASYTDSTGNTVAANPIVLDSGGTQVQNRYTPGPSEEIGEIFGEGHAYEGGHKVGLYLIEEPLHAV